MGILRSGLMRTPTLRALLPAVSDPRGAVSAEDVPRGLHLTSRPPGTDGGAELGVCRQTGEKCGGVPSGTA